MNQVWKCVVPLLIAAIGSGCAATGEQTPSATAENYPEQRLNEAMERVEENAAGIRQTQSELNELDRQMGELENQIETMAAEQNATLQEIKENVSFVNDQIRRLDSAMTSPPQSARKPAAPARVFKPGGFDVEASYQQALSAYRDRRYEAAINGFTELLTVAPTDPLADNAQYWIGESYYATGNYEKALEAFNRVFDFPESNKRADAQLKIGLTYLKMGDTAAARRELAAVTNNFAGTNAASIAAGELQKLGE